MILARIGPAFPKIPAKIFAGREKAWVEYGNIAKVKNAMMKLDPWHFIFGTIACDDLWMWSEAGAGLGLDVVMKENVSAGLPSCARAFSVPFADPVPSLPSAVWRRCCGGVLGLELRL